MFDFLMPAWARAVLAFIVAGMIFSAGWIVEGWRMEAELNRLKATYAEAQSTAAEQNATVLAMAQGRADAITKRLARTETALNQTAQEKNDALRRLTVGRPCLGSTAVRLLNGPRPPSAPAGLKLPRPVAEAAGEPVPTDAAFATDTDVGFWIGEAHRAYDTCRGRLAALDDFYAGSADE